MGSALPDMVRDAAFSAVSAAFASLGRICMALDGELRIRHASGRLDALLGRGTAQRVVGEPVEALLGPELFAPGSPLRQALERGERREGWRALLRAADGPARLVSVTAAPLVHDPHGVCDASALYLVVLRPAEDDACAAGAAEPTAAAGLVCRSPAMARVLRLVETLQHSDATVLVTGQSGTGKEVLARALHAHSPRRHGPFVVVNAAALPGELLESEIFGHVRGAFTGAVRDRPGRFEVATDGTLFLDEVGDVPLHLQVKLLRVLQERTYERVGEEVPRQTNARIIAATHRDLRAAIADGTFREDLYYRLKVIPIELPPLRARREDVEPIASLLLARVGARAGRALRFSPEALRALLLYEWPGNVRELENALEFAATICRGQTLQPEDLPPEIVAPRPRPTIEGAPARGASATDGTPDRCAAPDERAVVQRVLDRHRWNRAEAARALGVSRSTLWRRMRALGLARAADPAPFDGAQPAP